MGRLALPLLSPLGVILSGCVATSLYSTTVPLSYKSMEQPAATPAVRPCAALSEFTVEDARESKDLGRRSLERTPDINKPIALEGDPAAWVRTGAQEQMRRAGLRTGVAGQPALHMKVDQLTLSETVYVRATFDGRVTMSADLVPAGGTKACWTARISGFSQNYGYAGSTENYNETLNHALDRALIQLLSSSDFSENLCGKCGQ
ncbi:MAG TPA: hypothetical protein VFB20_03735 [Burkholderiales bacterium]|nr:hypothetical protein [Burkholderiales bacterium]